MKWFFRDITDDPSEKELTQQDQFNNDEVGLAEALVRETIQNSTDARRDPAVPVRVTFRIVEASGDAAAVFGHVLGGLSSHLDACQIEVPDQASSSRFLVIEDFETSGLTGAVNIKDDGQFCGFWRRFGRSNKNASQGGRWGLGKLVFPSASSIRMLIGLTRRAGDPAAYLMGQAILRNHAIALHEFDSVGFWADPNGGPKGLPTSDPHLSKAFAQVTGLKRGNEPGLSLVVPFLLSDIEPQHLVSAALRNYYYPILARGLSVTVDDIAIDADTFDAVCAEHAADAIPASVLGFVKQVLRRRTAQSIIDLPADWQVAPLTAERLGAALTERLRDIYRSGEMLAIRAPLVVQRRQGREIVRVKTHIDLFLRLAGAAEKCQTLVVRGSITVPAEGKKAALADCQAVLIAEEPSISQLLGDAENPAHTQWNERAEKLKQRWHSGGRVLRRVRGILHELHDIVAERIEREDPTALVDFFSIPKFRPGGRSANTPATMPEVTATPKPFRIEKRAGGFSILPRSESSEERPASLKIHVRCAYDVLTGNPFKRFSDYDFSFFNGKLLIEKENVDCWPTDPNGLDIETRAKDFKVDILGFDPNRDLIIEARG